MDPMTAIVYAAATAMGGLVFITKNLESDRNVHFAAQLQMKGATLSFGFQTSHVQTPPPDPDPAPIRRRQSRPRRPLPSQSGDRVHPRGPYASGYPRPSAGGTYRPSPIRSDYEEPSYYGEYSSPPIPTQPRYPRWLDEQ